MLCWNKKIQQFLIVSTSFLAFGASHASNSANLPNAGSMFSWTESQKVIGFSHTAGIFPTESFQRGAQPYPLPEAPPDVAARAAAVTYQYGLDADGSAHTGNTVQDYIDHNKVAGLLVIKNGAVVLERYARGINPSTLWDSKSVGKSVVSTLLGVALKQGYIHDLNDPVEQYIPELKASAYQGVTLRAMLQMSSGVAWIEDELDPNSDIKKLLGCGVRITGNANA